VNVSDKWQRVKALFGQALEQPEPARDAWLQQQCAGDVEVLTELRRLLEERRQSAAVFADDALVLLGRLMPESAPTDALVGTSIGAYRLLHVLGEGGMGRVYLAERADGQFRQQVALKLIRSEFATPELHQRFLRERDTLARLNHPNIAQLHDGGVSAVGAPYFTLEFIEGEPITRWCDARRLDIRARVRLLLKVCDAVEYAHRNLIVHRDLKPSNILVTEAGEAKLLDFGIAKPLSGGEAELTATQARPMTREYAAPEQVLGEPVTTATDVYGLGLLLYLLLCGRMPYRRAAAGESGWTKAIIAEAPEPLERALNRSDASAPVADHTPHPTSAVDIATLAAARDAAPKTLQRALRGDLERIIQRALAKAPEARYASVSGFADDLRAFLDGRAISGGTRTYQMRKFLGRHWLPLAAAGILLLVVLGSALVVAIEARQIEREAQSTAAVKDFLLGLFHSANPNVAKGKQLTARDLVDRGVQRLDLIPPEQAHLKAELQNTLGTIYYYLGYNKDAAGLHAQAFDAFKAQPGDALLAASAERFEATEVSTQGDNTRAQELADDAIRRLRATGHASAHDLARALSTAGWIAKKRGDYARSKQLANEAVALAQQPPADPGCFTLP
jgi:serine/threonine-protein kinase